MVGWLKRGIAPMTLIHHNNPILKDYSPARTNAPPRYLRIKRRGPRPARPAVGGNCARSAPISPTTAKGGDPLWPPPFGGQGFNCRNKKKRWRFFHSGIQGPRTPGRGQIKTNPLPKMHAKIVAGIISFRLPWSCAIVPRNMILAPWTLTYC